MTILNVYRGGQINISSKLGVKQVQQKYLKNVSGIRRSSEGYWNGYYINACELRPMSAEGRSHFQRVMNYLGKHNAVGDIYWKISLYFTNWKILELYFFARLFNSVINVKITDMILVQFYECIL